VEIKWSWYFPISSRRVTMLSGLADDMTIYGKRQNVLVVREQKWIFKDRRANWFNKTDFKFALLLFAMKLTHEKRTKDTSNFL
jgi:hypothetical protein